MSFDPPESIATGARGINDKDDVTGGYDVSGGDRICYFRDSEGDFHTFTDNAGDPQCGGASINRKGLITGQVGSKNSQCENAGQYHGFVRAPDGIVTTFDPSGSVDTQGLGINLDGQIGGFYLDSGCVFHGFLREPKGSGQFTIIDAKGAGTGTNQGTNATSINAGGAITGYFTNANGVRSGFLFPRKEGGKNCSKGCTTPFRVPGSAGSDRGSGMAINDSGVIAGSYTDSNGAYHGFVRNAEGMITKLNASGAGTGLNQGTYPLSINDGGVIAGHFVDSSNGTHGFLRSTKGKYTTFDVPGSTTGTTIVYSINETDKITGIYKDTNGQHGFVRSP